MIDDLIESLTQLHNRSASLAKFAGSALEFAPRSGTGTDRSGMISARVTEDGIPESVRIDQHWRRGIAARKFGAAVLEATHAALRDRLTAWSRTLADADWQNAAEVAPVPVAPPPLADQRRPRSIDAVAEDLITAFDAIRKLPTGSADGTTGRGRDRSDKLIITLSRAGVVSCEVDERWVAGQSAAALMNAIAEALALAKADLAERVRTGATAPVLDGLFVEALALLRNPRQMLTS